MNTNDEGESPLVRNMWETAIFGFTVTALVFSVPGNLPGIWEGPEKTPANFVYGAPACVESLLRSTGIDIRDGDTLIQPGFHEPIYASPKKYDAFMYKFGDEMPLAVLDCEGTAVTASAEQNTACLDDAQEIGFHFSLENANGGTAACEGATPGGQPVADWPNSQIDAVGAGGAAGQACDAIFPKPIITTDENNNGDHRIFSNRIWQESEDRFGTTTMGAFVTQPTVTTARPTRPATRPTFSYDQANVVFNVYHSQSLSPYLDAEKENTKCERILRNVRDRVSNDNWDFFDQQNLGDLMMCNIVYGWALGEYCASTLDEENLHLIGMRPNNEGVATNTVLDTEFGKLTAEIRAAARAKCENVTRTQCGTNYAAANGNVVARANTGDQGMAAAGTPPILPAAVGTTVAQFLEGLQDKPCIMKSGYGRSPVNGGRLFGNFIVANAKDTAGPVMPGSGMSPSVLEKFFDDLHGTVATEKPNHFVDIGEHVQDTTAIEDEMAISVGGDPRQAFTLYNTRTSEDADPTGNNVYDDNLDPNAATFARVNVPVTGIDSRYIYERLVYDFLVLAQMADKIDREDDFYNMLPAECFSDGSGSSVRTGTRFTWTVFLVTLLLFLLPRLPGISSLTKSYGYTLPLPRVEPIEDSNGLSNGLVSEATQTKIIFLLSMIVGILGFSISMAINPDGPRARDGETSGIQAWASVLDSQGILPDDGNFFQNENTALHRTSMFLNDIANGNYHRAYGLDEDEQYNAYILSIMCAMITTLGVIMILFKRVGSGAGEAVLSKGKLIGDWA